MRRRDILRLVAYSTAAWPFAAAAQQRTPRRIGYLDYGAGMLPNGEFAPFHDMYRRKPFLEGLRDRGWVEGQNVTIERRFAAGQADRLPALAAGLVGLNVEAILAGAAPAAKAAQKANNRIAILEGEPGGGVEHWPVARPSRPGA